MTSEANFACLIDFGSTYTKVALVDLCKEELIARHQSVSTVREGIAIGLQKALDKFTSQQKDAIRMARKIACSSAAGGLQVVVVGLVPELTVEAARRTVLGAGAKIVATHSYELSDSDVKAIANGPCDLILLVGGIDGGNKDVIIHNAAMLTQIRLDVPIIVAGNKVVSGRCEEILRSADKYVEVVENLLPELDKLNVEPARALIREIFMKRIVRAKGLDKAQEYVGDIIMPTPMATLKAGKLLAEGTDEEAGIGELMIVEIGGATTNVHSLATGYPADPAVVFKGLPEPYAKRTVEGDLGIRYNARTILDMLGETKILRVMPGLDANHEEFSLIDKINQLSNDIGFVPEDDLDFLVDIALARSAVEVAVDRHAGVITEIPSLHGTIRMQFGKDLTEIRTVIGTGGIFTYGRSPEKVLEGALFSEANPTSLKPKKPELYIDEQYLIYGVGLLSEFAATKALRIAKKYLRRL